MVVNDSGYRKTVYKIERGNGVSRVVYLDGTDEWLPNNVIESRNAAQKI